MPVDQVHESLIDCRRLWSQFAQLQTQVFEHGWEWLNPNVEAAFTVALSSSIASVERVRENAYDQNDAVCAVEQLIALNREAPVLYTTFGWPY